MIFTRGDKLNNPGNIVHGDPWQGLADDQPDPKFAKFKSPVWGFRAMAVTLVAYQDRHKLNTIRGIITRWAPPTENNTAAYIYAVSKETGFGADDALDLHKYSDAYKVIRAITIREQGAFEGVYTKSQLDAGCVKAGLEGAPIGAVGSYVKTAAAAAAAASAHAASDPGALANVYSTVKPIVDVGPDFLKHAFWWVVAIALCGLALGEFVQYRNKQVAA